MRKTVLLVQEFTASLRHWLGPARSLLVGLLCFGAIAFSAPVSSSNKMDLALKYDFYLGGLSVGEAELEARVDQEHYKVMSKLRTSGVVGWFYDMEVITSADGSRLGVDEFLPAVFELKSRTKEKHQDVTVAFSGSAPSSVQADPPFRKKSYEIDPTKQIGTLDPVSAAIAAFLPKGVEDICNRSLKIFDGRRRYDVDFVSIRDEVRDKDGHRIECNGVFRRVAGYRPKTMRKRTEFDFYIRFEVQQDGSAHASRIWGDTDFGTAIAVLR
ncbi:MAG: DUF3108 domain-containing protein [Neomegalonema sp.]|nr:DUF3108 domain-containing protein [Neomegalonema sp.]